MLTALAIARATWGFLGKIPWQAWAALTAIAALWWAYHSGYQKRDWEAKTEIAELVSEYTREQAEAERLALAAKAETERRYQDLAERTDDEHARTQAVASDATDRFIADNRVQPCPVGSASGTALASPDSGDPGVSAPVPADVVMGEAEVRSCAALYAYSVAAHEWAGGLGD